MRHTGWSTSTENPSGHASLNRVGGPRMNNDDLMCTEYCVNSGYGHDGVNRVFIQEL